MYEDGFPFRSATQRLSFQDAMISVPYNPDVPIPELGHLSAAGTYADGPTVCPVKSRYQISYLISNCPCIRVITRCIRCVSLLPQ